MEGKFRQIQTDRIDMFYLYRIDPEVAIEYVLGTVIELLSES